MTDLSTIISDVQAANTIEDLHSCVDLSAWTRTEGRDICSVLKGQLPNTACSDAQYSALATQVFSQPKLNDQDPKEREKWINLQAEAFKLDITADEAQKLAIDLGNPLQEHVTKILAVILAMARLNPEVLTDAGLDMGDINSYLNEATRFKIRSFCNYQVTKAEDPLGKLLQRVVKSVKQKKENDERRDGWAD